MSSIFTRDFCNAGWANKISMFFTWSSMLMIVIEWIKQVGDYVYFKILVFLTVDRTRKRVYRFVPFSDRFCPVVGMDNNGQVFYQIVFGIFALLLKDDHATLCISFCRFFCPVIFFCHSDSSVAACAKQAAEHSVFCLPFPEALSSALFIKSFSSSSRSTLIVEIRCG